MTPFRYKTQVNGVFGMKAKEEIKRFVIIYELKKELLRNREENEVVRRTFVE